MTTRILVVALAAAGIAAAGGYGLYSMGMNAGMKMAAPAEPPKAATGRRVLYLHDPMVPGQKFDKPGKYKYHCEYHPRMKATIVVEE